MGWIAGAIKRPGALRKSLGAKPGKKIPAKKLNAAAKKTGIALSTIYRALKRSRRPNH